MYSNNSAINPFFIEHKQCCYNNFVIGEDKYIKFYILQQVRRDILPSV